MEESVEVTQALPQAAACSEVKRFNGQNDGAKLPVTSRAHLHSNAGLRSFAYQSVLVEGGRFTEEKKTLTDTALGLLIHRVFIF